MFNAWNYHKFYGLKLDLTSRKLSFLINQSISQCLSPTSQCGLKVRGDYDQQRFAKDKYAKKAVTTGQADCSA